MSVPRRILALRLIALFGLVGSAALTSDALSPDEHGFCPLEAACAAARSSALGSVLGVPTSSLGLMAFGGLLLVTLLPPKAARTALRPAGFFAAFCGAGLVAYQAFVLGRFCPLCIVADASGLAAGVAVFGWHRAPGRGRGHEEHVALRLRWTLAGMLAVAVPLLWPHPPPRPSWVPIPEAAGVETADDAPTTPAARPDPAPEPESDGWVVPKPRTEPLPERLRAGLAGREEAPPAARVEPVPSAARIASAPPWSAAPDTPSPAAPPAAAPREFPLVEYLNPFCSHCRATHARLDRVLESTVVAARRQRVYVWPAGDPPLWAHACVCARAQGKEDALFAELLRTDEQSAEDIWAAARTVGIDVAVLSTAIDRGDARPPLQRGRQRVVASRIVGLPTLDIGRRRLQGEQSEDELRAAIDAAVADLPPVGVR